MSGITLKKIFDEPVLFKGFGDFCRTQHAYENLEFWLAADCLKENFKDPSLPPTPREPSLATSPTSFNSRKSSRKTFWGAWTSQSLQRSGSKQNLAEDRDILTEVKRVYDTFLAPNAGKWVCVDQNEQEEIKRRIDASNVDYRIFDTVQRQVYVNMEKDLVPRFAKAFEAEETVFQNATSPRGSVRFVPDPKLRATMRTTGE